MKNTFRCTVFATLTIVAMLAARPASAQQVSDSSIVVIDIGKVFKEHVRLTQAMKLLGEEVKKYDGYLRQQQGDLKGMAEQRSKEKPGTPGYKNLDTQITKRQSELQLEMQLKKREFMEREAKLFYNTYTEVTQKVAQFADANKIRLVIRYDSEPIKRDDRNSVLKGVNNEVVFQRNLDITSVIIRSVNQGSRPDNEVGRNGNQIPPQGRR